MVDSAVSYERSMEAAGAAVAKGDRANAERSLRSAILAVEGREGSQLELATALVRLGALKLEMGGAHEEAEGLISRALVISESQLGEGHQDLVLLLNDLSRLYLKHAAHAAAEPLLIRLLALKRSKGEDHPEVATVLASLAAVHQALGRYDSAEQLWRRVLDIRERTLAPNHFTIATALEHLGETCAARGRVKEALQHYQRAQTVRERTLGAEHTSLRVSRERIADLQLQAAEDSLDSSEGPPEVRRLAAGDPLGISLMGTPARESAAPIRGRESPSPFLFEFESQKPVEQQRPMTPPAPAPQAKVHAPPKAPAAPAPAAHAPAAHAPAPRAPIMEAPAAEPETPQTEGVPYLNVLLDIKGELEDSEEPAVAATSTGTFFASVNASLRKHRLAAMIGLGAIALPLVAVAMVSARSRSSSGFVEQANAAPRPALTDSLSAPTQIADVTVRPQGATTDAPKERNASSSRATEDRSSGRSDEVATITMPTVPQPAVGKLDSVVRALTAPMRAAVESSPSQVSLSTENTLGGNAFGPAGKPTRARIIGVVPSPRYPDQLRFGSVAGEVRVRFDVDTLGRPIMSTFSVSGNPHALLVSAVRRVIPEMRFDPARTPWPEAKAIVDRVEMDFRFTPNGKN